MIKKKDLCVLYFRMISFTFNSIRPYRALSRSRAQVQASSALSSTRPLLHFASYRSLCRRRSRSLRCGCRARLDGGGGGLGGGIGVGVVEDELSAHLRKCLRLPQNVRHESSPVRDVEKLDGMILHRRLSLLLGRQRRGPAPALPCSCSSRTATAA